ncbi:M23 family metallopeptidase [Paenibacillus sp. GCM10027627]|uniref:M23 family metallopeptidase n=1 Tax=unclassified Paenibacillus TaxID=185978 RepID=UPI00363D20D8
MNKVKEKKKMDWKKILSLVIFMTVIITGCSNDSTTNKGGNAVTNGQKEESGTENKSKVEAKNIAAALLDKQYEQLYTQFGEGLRGAITLEDFKAMGDDFVSDIDSFNVTTTGSLNGYESFVWADSSGKKGLTATVDKKGIIEVIQLLNHTLHPETDNAYSKTIIEFPFKDEWFVFWGGHNTLLNYHYEYKHIRYAYDLVKVKDGYSYEGDPTKNESYFAFGQDMLAPASGVVVEAVDGIPDNEPVGKMNAEQPMGNMVLIKHDNGEYSMMAHLKNGSVKVKKGDTVKVGELIGECGNSGNSSEAHLHFQMMPAEDNGKILTTIPVSFKDGSKPIRGEMIGNAKP